MGKKRSSSPLPAAAIVVVLLVVLGAWLYQMSLRHAWFARPSTQPTATTVAPQSLPATTAPVAPPPPKVTSPPQPAPPITRDLRIASWNIRHLGSRTSTRIDKVAKLIADNGFDVVAIQEIQKDGRGVDALLNQLGAPWRGTRIGPASRSGERLGYIYRGDRVVELKPAADLAGATAQVFERIPYAAHFRAGNFDFELVTVHLSWGDVAQRQSEMQTLAELVAAKAVTQSEKDIILLGDFNEQKSRPNLPYLKEIGWQSIITSPTNLGSREIYDHIIFHGAHTREYTATAGVIAFDELHYANDDKTAANELSDHRPVFADFAVHLVDDD